MTTMPLARRSTGYLAVFLLPFVVYWQTAYPTITWWDSSSYSLAAATMGVASPPGSLLLTLVGWVFAHLPLGVSVARVLNIVAGGLAGLCVVLVFTVALRLLRYTGRDTPSPAIVGAALGALTFAFSPTVWEHAVKFTPYILSAVFTGCMLLVMIRWWEDADHANALQHVALLGLLFGLDFSVHRTNALLAPGVLVWMAMRNVQALTSWRTWLVGTGGVLAGLTVQLLVIPIARFTRSPLNWNDPTSLQGLWNYVSLEQLGGGFLVQFLPRNADVVSVQTADLLRVLRDNFIVFEGAGHVPAVLAALTALLGLTTLWQRNRRLGAAFALVLFLQAAMTVLYFNIPANYFRAFDRHYLPVCVTIGVAMACGTGATLQAVAALLATRRRAVAALCAVLVLLMPIAPLIGNWQREDASHRYFAADFARNMLEALPPAAILFTVGDNDTFPLLYLQAVEHVRPDVQIVNTSLANAPAYVRLLHRLDPALPLSTTEAERRAGAQRDWTDTTLVLPVAGSLEQVGLRNASTLPRTMTVHPSPMYGTKMTPGELVVLDIVRTNGWRRPLCFSITGSGGLGWLESYARLDGLYWRIVPMTHPPADAGMLRASFAHYAYRGYADPAVVIDDATRTMSQLYYQAFAALLDAEADDGATDRCRAARAAFLQSVPPERLGMAEAEVAAWRARCGG